MPSNADVAWLEGLELFGWKLGLERMDALLERLGRPERRFRAIHVVGTNGKTTVTRTAEALLLAEGVATGAYTSPHVTGWAERIRAGGAEADIERALARVRPAAEEVGATQFEVLTAAAFAEFAAAGVEAAVVEAGLGGRLDATNVLAAPVVVLTNVGLEHTEHLGTTREAIAAEKLAVLTPGSTLVTGETEWEAAARALGAARVVVPHAAPGPGSAPGWDAVTGVDTATGRDSAAGASAAGSDAAARVGAGELGAAAGADATAGPDAAAASNTAAGLDAAAGLGAAAGADAAAGPDVAAELGGAAEPAAVAGPRGLAREAVAALLGRPVGSAPVVEVPGRLEQVDEAPLEIWDGAHNPAGVAYLAAHLPPRQDWTLVLSILRDKDTEAMLARFGRLGSRLVATSSDAARALPAAQLANRARPFFAEIEAVDSPQEARRRARSLAGPEGAVLVSGSLTLVAALAVVRPASVR